MTRFDRISIHGRQKPLWSDRMDDLAVPDVRKVLLVSLSVAVAGLLTIPFDHAIVASIKSYPLRGEFRALLQRAEPFGHGWGVTLIVLTWIVLCRPTIRRSAAVTASACGAGIVANIIKTFVVRSRPSSLPDNSIDESFSFVDLTASPISTLSEHVCDNAQHSFPSAHTATAFGLAVALGHLFPRGRIWFFVLGLLVGCQRINVGSHYPGDVLCGAAIGIAVGALAMCQLAVSDNDDKR